MNANLQTATLAGGCFWCLEAVFDGVKGVDSVESGYSGGTKADPSYREILNVFFAIHDPTTRDRQGADIGTQYRSAIFYHDDGQKASAEALIKELNDQHIWDKPIVTEVTKFEKFYMAEDYHQEYFANNPYQPYCQAVVAPKVAKFRQHHLDMLKKQTA